MQSPVFDGERELTDSARADIAVIGMACRLPDAANYEAYWENLAAGRSSIREVPAERWDWRAVWGDPETQENKCNSRWAGFIDDVDAFDAAFFKTSRRDAELWDPQQRIMLELAWACLEDAGLRPSSVWGSPVGVYMGSAVLDYKELIEEEGRIEAQYAAAVAHSVIASRISHWFNFTGPSVPIDTACSSSLYAIHLAIQSLRRGECSMALAGGVNVLLTPRRFISFSKMGILSPTGACRSFDDAADGTVRGEGAGLILLKPLRDALRDGDPIHGIIKGSAINHSGKTHTLTYPNPVAQAKVIREAWRDARVAPESISYVEAHGTGTPKGDPLEFEGLVRAFEGVSGARCAISSVKSNIGHLESAAGIAGVIKVLMSMKHGGLAPLQGFRTLNHRISLDGTPFSFVERPIEWRSVDSDGAPRPLRAGVSSFGFAGTNAHVVLEAAPPGLDAKVPRAASVLICLSAKTEEALRRGAGSLGWWLATHRDVVTLEELGAALLGTKERFSVRLALVASDADGLIRDLEAFEGGADVPASWHGRSEEEKGSLLREVGGRLLEGVSLACGGDDVMRREKLSALGELFVKGVELDWPVLSGGIVPRGLRLPPYPFERERYWLPTGERDAEARRTLHPLVHENVSDLTAQRFASVFDGTEPFLAHHVVRNEKVLPASAYLEMARAAITRSLPGSGEMRLRDVTFLRPLHVGDAARRVDITISSESSDAVAFRVSGAVEGEGDPIVYCEGRATFEVSATGPRIDLEGTRAACARRALEGEACYRALRELGFEHGKTHRGLEEVLFGERELLARLRAAPERGASTDGLFLPPGLLDSALQAALVLMIWDDDGVHVTPGRLPVPFAMEEMGVLRAWPVRSWVRVRAVAADDVEHRFDLDLCDDDGEIFARVRDLTVRWAGEDSSVPTATGELLVTREWRSADAAPPPEMPLPIGVQRLVLLCEPKDGIAHLVAARLDGARCVSLAAAGHGPADRFVNAAAATLDEVRALLHSTSTGPVLVQIVLTAVRDRMLGALAGILKSAAHERPGFVGQVIDLDDLDDPQRVAAALAECARTPGEAEITYRNGARLVPRWRELDAAAESVSPWRDGGVYLLSGGAGGIGLLVAEEIARTAKSATVHLIGRSGPSEAVARRLEGLAALGCTVRHSRVDVTKRDAVDALVARIQREDGRLDGVVHAAGILRDDFILRKNREVFKEVLSVKVHGAVNLDDATKDLPLDFFLLFSSVAGMLGNAGQADYAAANAFLDAYAAHRAELGAARQRSGRTLAIDWPLWQRGGMRVGPEIARALWERMAMSAIDARDGFRALRRALGSSAPQVLFVQGDIARLRRDVLEAPGTLPHTWRTPPATRSSTVAHDTAADPKELGERALDLVTRELSAVLKIPPARMPADAPMESHGVDSIAVTQLTRQLERTFGPLPKTLFFEYRSIRELTAYLLQAHGARMRDALGVACAGGTATAPRAAATRESAKTPPTGLVRPGARISAPEARVGGGVPIAIVGVAGRYPGARNVREFWANLRDGRDCVTEIPPDRWDHGRYFHEEKGRPGKTYSRWGGFIDGVDEFDPLFFNISPREAEIMDPQERLFLECVHETLEDAGYTRDSLRAASNGRVGVYAGVMWEEYPLYAAQEQARGRNITVTGSPASIANRVSYIYDLNGPSMAVDTLCSSSLTAIHLACQSLQRGECALAVAGGVNVSIHPNKYLSLAAGRYVSSKGRCESFGEGGDGYVPGEGVGAVLLKPLARAVADGDQIYGVIRGTAVNHGGKTNGFTVPSPRAQSAVIGAALEAAGVSPRAVSYIEAHGTGTSLGDPIEIAGLTKAFEAAGALEPGFCAIGSAKSNIGHCESAAGIAGLTKVLLQLKHRQLAPSLHAERLNPAITFEQTPFRVQRTLAAWERPSFDVEGQARVGARIAGISSFGAGGSNAHLIIEEYEEAPGVATAPEETAPSVVVLSARDDERLRASAGRLLEAIRAGDLRDDRVADIAYTLQVGREAMEERLGVIVSSMGELEEKLARFLEGRQDIDAVSRGRASGGARTLAGLAADEDMGRTLEAWMAKQKHAKLLSLWLEGLPLDWTKLHRPRRPRRISLPTYPFARERYWIPAFDAEATSRSHAAHPFLQENTSDLTAQRFTTTFTGDEPSLRDHVVGNRKVLPGAAQLEMARAAVEVSSRRLGAGAVVCLEDVAWPAPAAVDGEPLRVTVELSADERGRVDFELRGEHESVGGDTPLFGRGTAILGPPPPAETLDIDALRRRCRDGEIDGAACYAAFESIGITFGPTHRGVERIHLGRGEALAKLSLPAAARTDDAGSWGLHPMMLDSAFQAAIAVLRDETRRALLPFSLSALRIHGLLEPSMWAHVRRAEVEGREGAEVFDIDLCDDAGHVRARLTGLELRATKTPAATEVEVQAMLLAPVWEAVVRPPSPELVASGPEEQTLVIRPSHAEPLEALTARVRALGVVRRVMWIAPEVPPSEHSDELLRQQDAGVLQLFRLIKALLELGYGSRRLDWFVVTRHCLEITSGHAIEPTHAGAHGLAGSMGEEFPTWSVRILDVDRELSTEEIQTLEIEPRARPWALRGAELYEPRLVPIRDDLARREDRGAPYGTGRVYVVIGGAGGVGEVWSEHVIRAHRARVVWIGRRPLDGTIQRKIDRLAALGPAPLYLQADATRPESLRAALTVVKRTFSEVHGVVHSAIVLEDRSLAKMDEETFRAAYAAKVDTSVRMAEVFGGEPLDFALFFSSTLGLVPFAGQANYAAGCAFEDAFARSLNRHWSCPVKVMNWGYWGEHGVVAGEIYRERMAQLGVGSIAPAEAMAALDVLLTAPLPQTAFLKANARGRLPSTAADEVLTVYEEEIPTALTVAPAPARGVTEKIVAAAEAQATEERELLEELLALQMSRAGFDGDVNLRSLELRPHFYRLWFEESRALLAAREARRARAPSEVLARWKRAMDVWRGDPHRRARAELLDTMLMALPDILSGARSATDVMFPRGRFELVEGIYHKNPVADFFNASAARAVAAYLEERLRRDPSLSIRVLEVGAGTGAGSSAILGVLDAYGARVAEYCFTDVSRAFVLGAEDANAGKRPFVRAKVFDVNLPVAEQEVEAGAYDLAIAVNVLHATTDVRRSLRNVKAALKKNGVLVMNELSQKSLFGHLTFGLLEGWWNAQDSTLRIPGSPVLSPETWRRVLEHEGFDPVLFPASEAHGAGQQIILAQSDGVARQESRGRVPLRPRRDEAPREELAAPAPAPCAADGAHGDAPLATESDILRARGRAYVARVVGELLKIDADRIQTSESLGRYGIDSILIARLTSALRDAFGEVKSTLLFEHQTIDAVVEELLRTRREALATLPEAPSKKGADQTAPPPSEHRARTSARRRGRGTEQNPEQASPGAVAIVGLAGRYPKANDVRAFWKNLRSGRNCISEVPKERWDWRDYFGDEKGVWGTLYTKWGGFLHDIARFDPAFFRLSPRDATQMDPQERLFLEVAYASIEDAGYTPSTLSPNKQVGVFVGVMNAHYGHGPTHWSIANRVSYVLDLQGPSLAVDTACSSSLTAVHLALDSLRAGTCECAIAGGVNLIVDPVHPMRLAAASMLSAGNECRAFGAGADGMVDGEAVGAVVLKPLARAIEDGDHIYGIILGSMINAGGRTNGYTVPNPAAQERVVAEALRRAGVTPRMVSYVEAHGTGTELGDPIEIAGLARAFNDAGGEEQFCALGSAKSNIGHCESAAGIAGLTKVLLQMRHREVAPTLHASPPNPRIDFAQTPFRLQRALGPWARPLVSTGEARRELPRIAGISSFGAGGANAHLVVQEHADDRRAEAASAAGPVAIVLSARTEQELLEKARQMVEFIEEGELDGESLADIAFTLQVGREAMDERLGMVSRSLEEVRDALAAFARGDAAACRRGRVDAGEREPRGLPGSGEHQAGPLAPERIERELDAWLAGRDVDWTRLHANERRRRVGLPTYPFGGDRYWSPARAEHRTTLRAPLPTRHAAGAEDVPSPAPPPPATSPERPITAEEPSRKIMLVEPGTMRMGAPSDAQTEGPPKTRLRPLPPPGAELRRSVEAHQEFPATAHECPKPLAPPTEPTPAPNAARLDGSLREELVTSLAKALYARPEDIDVDKKFVDMGLDSIVGVEWIRTLNKKLGTSFKATLVYDHPTVRTFEHFLTSQLAPPPAPARAPQPPDAQPVRTLRDLLLQVQRGEVSVEEASRLRLQASGARNGAPPAERHGGATSSDERAGGSDVYR